MNQQRSRFRHLVHSDWCIRAEGRWSASALQEGGRWHVGCPRLTGALPDFVDRLQRLDADGPTLAGFDFPIGLPAGYGLKTGFEDFRSALAAFGSAPWERIFDVAATVDDIAVGRPFYPATPGGTARAHLLDGHGVAHIDALTRRCERGGPGLKAAGCMFWTLGANQVGKAALHGWRNVVKPAVAGGAKLWPFEGELPDLAKTGGLTLRRNLSG